MESLNGSNQSFNGNSSTVPPLSIPLEGLDAYYLFFLLFIIIPVIVFNILIFLALLVDRTTCKVGNICVSIARMGFPAQLQRCRCRLPSCHPALHLACYPFFLIASDSRLQFYCPKCTYPGRVIITLMHCTLLK